MAALLNISFSNSNILSSKHERKADIFHALDENTMHLSSKNSHFVNNRPKFTKIGTLTYDVHVFYVKIRLTSVESCLSKWQKCRSCSNFGQISGRKKVAHHCQELQG